MSRTLAFALMLFSAPLFGQLSILSVDPDSGPVTGGTEVTIRGTGFAPSAYVRFGDESFDLVQRRVDAQTILVVSPPHGPGTVDITVFQESQEVTLKNAFTYFGDLTEAWEAILIPIYPQSLAGAFGSHWRTEFVMHNGGQATAQVEGLYYVCNFDPCPLPPRLEIRPGETMTTARFLHTPGNPGRLIYLRDPEAKIRFNLRVRETSFWASAGTELPVVREDEFSSERIQLLNIPLEAGRRLLRIYSLHQESAEVRLYAHHMRADRFDRPIGSMSVVLEPQQSLYSPAYTELDPDVLWPELKFPSTLRLDIVPVDGATRIWGFVTLTKNDNQVVTTITPN